MYVLPNTDIRLCRGVPINNTYQDTLYFDNATNQYNYFNSKVVYAFNPTTYQRVGKNALKIHLNATACYDLNYMMFVNVRDNANKWWYAFITNVEYINENTTRITYEIDVMQSYMFDYKYEYCFVAREHVANDTIGLHLEPEPVSIGEYVYNDYGDITPILQSECVIVATADSDETNVGRLYDGIYGGCRLAAFNTNDEDTIAKYVYKYVKAGHPDEVVSMYMAPTIATGQALHNGQATIIDKSDKGEEIVVSGKPAMKVGDSLDGYVPNNNKLYTYPYNFLNITAGSSSLVLRYEFFKNGKPELRVNVPLTQPIECILRPYNYKGCGEQTMNNESISLGNYPTCSWNIDSYTAWLAQNSVPMAMQLGTSLLLGGALGAAGAIAGGVATGIGALASGMSSTALTVATGAATALPAMNAIAKPSQNLFQTVVSQASDRYSASIAADMFRGNTNSGNGNVSAKTQSFYGGRMSLTSNQARIIDNFFDMFGYAVNRVKIPNTHNRPHWNYVQTKGCTILGNVPSDDMSRICTIHDNGITFWKNPDEVGQYSLDNRITTE